MLMMRIKFAEYCMRVRLNTSTFLYFPPDLLEEEPQFMAEVVATEQGHRVLRVTHSNGSSGGGGSGGQPTPVTSQFHYDFVNAQLVDHSTPVAPSLNRFPSFKGASIWRSK
jgi:hypothetical protein